MDDDGLPLNANGPAYTARQPREGVPLSYVGDKLGHAVEELHRYALGRPADQDALVPAMHYLLVAYLGLHNMLAKVNDRSLTGRMLSCSDKEL